MNNQNFGIINISRIKQFFGVAISFNIIIDNVLMGEISSDMNLSFTVPYGHHNVTLKKVNHSVPIEIDLSESQKNVDIVCKAGWGALVARPKLVSVNYR